MTGVDRKCHVPLVKFLNHVKPASMPRSSFQNSVSLKSETFPNAKISSIPRSRSGTKQLGNVDGVHPSGRATWPQLTTMSTVDLHSENTLPKKMGCFAFTP